jgi:protein-L-isoaspartate(D-aspartate) O-methyltransferase
VERGASPDIAVADAVRRTPRDGFLPVAERRHAWRDVPLMIGHGQTNSQPSTVVDMLTLLDVRPGQRVLDVGSGSGWTTAILAALVGPEGEVLGLEIVPELARWGAENVAATGRTWPRVEVAEPGVLGRPEQGPYDRILVSAMARHREDLDPLTRQLARGGILVAPAAGRMLRLRKLDAPESQSGTEVSVERFGPYRFVPLV